MTWEEYRAEALSKLGADFTVEDLRNEERWHLKVLEALDNYSGGGSGGGGSSDFSTAEVTFSGTDGTLATMPLIINTPFNAILPLQNEVNDETYTIALYKGKAIINLGLEGLGQTVTPSGDIELLEGESYLVTGNGTITIS